jgi:hypothetical protein
MARALPPAAAAVVKGWRARARHAELEIRQLEPELAKATPREAAFAPATLLRAEWRIYSGDAALAQEALALIDSVLSTGAEPVELLLRARAAAAAGRHDVALATLEDFGRMQQRSASSPPLAQAALGILDGLNPTQLADRTDRVRARLQRLLQ